MYRLADHSVHLSISLRQESTKLTEFWPDFISAAFESSVISSAFVSMVISSAFKGSVISSAYEGVPKIMHIQHKSAAGREEPGASCRRRESLPRTPPRRTRGRTRSRWRRPRRATARRGGGGRSSGGGLGPARPAAARGGSLDRGIRYFYYLQKNYRCRTMVWLCIKRLSLEFFWPWYLFVLGNTLGSKKMTLKTVFDQFFLA